MKNRIVNVFSIDGKGGNPCAVLDITSYNYTNEELQAIATGIGLPETVFIKEIKLL